MRLWLKGLRPKELQVESPRGKRLRLKGLRPKGLQASRLRRYAFGESTFGAGPIKRVE